MFNLESKRCLVPVIDVLDHSAGNAAPAFALTGALPGTGSDYLLMGLGASMVGGAGRGSCSCVRKCHHPACPWATTCDVCSFPVSQVACLARLCEACRC